MKKVVFILIVIVLLYIINGLVHSIFDIYQKKDLLTSAQKELEAERLKNSKLKADLSYAQTEQFIEEEARNKLFLVKEGEERIVISEDLLRKPSQVKKQELPNWQQWLNLFF